MKKTSYAVCEEPPQEPTQWEAVEQLLLFEDMGLPQFVTQQEREDIEDFLADPTQFG
jgi:hypothetical protein